ncbi:MAG TPA: tetratricopeptide repeat protein [Opitutaceae bacterium]|jgi:outer membrane protein assembly factor BamD|nr:tetratricopeptide repeat protein [Opitutaceae bacterium]
MPFVVLRNLCFTLIAIAASVLLTAHARADLVWTPEGGWQLEGGVLSGLAETEGRNAIDLMNKGRAAEEKGHYSTAISYYTKAVKKYPNSIWAPEALYRTAHLRFLRKQYYKAFDDYQRIIGTYPNTKRFDEIIGRQYHIATILLNGGRNHFFFALIPGFTNREKGVEDCEQVVLNAPYNTYSPLALLESASGQRRAGNIEEAIDALDRFINSYPQNIMAPDAYLKLAQMNAALVDGPDYDQASTKEAITYYQDFMILFPGDHNIGVAEQGLSDMKQTLAESKIKMADFYFYKRSNFVAARVFYNEAITSYPDSNVATLAKKRLAAVEAAAEKARNSPAPKKKFLGVF